MEIINMDTLQDRLYIPYSMSMFKRNYYADGDGPGFWNGSGNGFYNFVLDGSDYSPIYDVNCLFIKN